jgi:hypothetical protein
MQRAAQSLTRLLCHNSPAQPHPWSERQISGVSEKADEKTAKKKQESRSFD